MKELYLNPEMAIVNFSAADVITTSNGDGETTTGEWVPRVNEGAPDYNAWG